VDKLDDTFAAVSVTTDGGDGNMKAVQAARLTTTSTSRATTAMLSTS